MQRRQEVITGQTRGQCRANAEVNTGHRGGQYRAQCEARNSVLDWSACLSVSSDVVWNETGP